MNKEIINFSDIENKKHKFHHFKNTISLNDVNVDNIFISTKIYFGKRNYKYSISVTEMNIKLILSL